MNIEITKTTEQAIKQALATGQFSTAEAFLEAASQDFVLRHPSATADQQSQSAFEAFDAIGAIGCVNGPDDLSTNPEHMEGFGR
ncbi:hypothetical protein K227x_58870 [Rubripirellula lacrimiformis]|uniref:Uncharacterized protein n=1 Tax=Rubripirellula lacrimiformis TaxID=1930273 RepID=A0A517NK17_9BACT|nr:hypothetical protein [Rubripirellula lacrimiformis]QDT07460.1 hypothetical protein K227x_58870 [Rubripirellula lacrimiformis]